MVNERDHTQRLQQARSFLQQRQYPEALRVYAQLSREFPAASNIQEEYGRVAALTGDHESAVRVWETALRNELENAELHMRIAREFFNLRLHSKAMAVSRKAVELAPQNLEALVYLASLLARGGTVEEAQAVVERCLKLDPRSEHTRYFSAHLTHRENKLAEAEQQFRHLLASGLRDSNAIYYSHFELARILDKTDRHDEAMTELQAAKSMAAKCIKLDTARKSFDDWRERLARQCKSLPKNAVSTWAQFFPPEKRATAPSLAFLGGHPRSGTTLLERMLDAHPSVMACDESQALQSITPSVDVLAPKIAANQLNSLRERYVKNLATALGERMEGKVLLDKNPAMSIVLPEFLRVFPELRVIIALRDPRDVLVSCFFEEVIQYTQLSFENLAQQYAAIMDVWLAVREWDGLAFLETRYEDIIADVEKEGRAVTKFLGLEWHENQARFHERNREKAIMSTSNYTSVTSPVHARSKGRWQNYEKHLEPVLPLLEPYCIKFGYA